jgi:hypothetical protein
MITDETQPQEAPHENTRCIRCPDCGEEIMMVPVLSQMIEAIENHISTHREHPHPRDDSLPHPRAPNIEETLAEQVLTRAAEISDALSKNSTWINQQ